MGIKCNEKRKGSNFASKKEFVFFSKEIARNKKKEKNKLSYKCKQIRKENFTVKRNAKLEDEMYDGKRGMGVCTWDTDIRSSITRSHHTK